jgi:predicted HTH transcriptional regulator
MIIEFKNYSIPIKDSKSKWVLLKTITGFLNCKGGTIYIGVDDRTGKVEGLEINRKEQDDFKLSIKALVERINPVVDLKSK